MIPRQRVAVKYEVAAHAPGGELFKRFMLFSNARFSAMTRRGDPA